MMNLSRCFGIVCVLCLALPAMAADKPFPESMVTLRAQPAVFFVRATADVDLTVPESISVNFDVLKQDVGAAPNPGGVPLPDRYWDQTLKSPDKYLVASKQQKTVPLSGVTGWSGSAFAISREGILLTNAHVVCTGPERVLGPNDYQIMDDQIQQDVVEITKVLGKPTFTEERAYRALSTLYSHYAARSRVVSRFKAARIVLDYRVNRQKAVAALKERGLEALFRSTEREEISVPATVLASGEWLPGKDVAVLKVTFEPEEQARLIERSKQQNLPGLQAMLADIQNDRIVCLPLGNVNDVLPQARVQSLGFPGVAFGRASMDPESQFKVTSKGGQISQTKRMSTSGGWDIFEMNTDTNSGESGGPVLDIGGKVIALNVGGVHSRDEATLLRLAIPVNVAQQMLTELGIKPDPGKLSAHWDQGLRLYAEGKYEESLQQIQTAIKIQKGNSLQGDREASWYLRDMAGRCLQKLGRIPAGP